MQSLTKRVDSSFSFISAPNIGAPSERDAQTLRIATFNIREAPGPQVERSTARARAQCPAQERRRDHPTGPADILLVNEIDYDDATRVNARHFVARYLNIAQHGQDPIDYPYEFFEPVNSGVPSGMDLDNDGSLGGTADALGYGRYPGPTEWFCSAASRWTASRRGLSAGFSGRTCPATSFRTGAGPPQLVHG